MPNRAGSKSNRKKSANIEESAPSHEFKDGADRDMDQVSDDNQSETEAQATMKHVLTELKNITAIVKGLNSKFDALDHRIQILEVNSNRVDKSIKDIKSDVTIMNARIQNIEAELANPTPKKEFPAESTLIATKVPFELNENTVDVANDMISQLNELDDTGNTLNGVTVINAIRVKPRGAGPNSRPGLMKIQLKSEKEKVQVLRAKQNLKKCEKYKNVYLRSSKSHEERLIELNFKTLLKELNLEKQYHFTGSGRMIKHGDDHEGNNVQGLHD